ncbi:MAG: signal peptidase, endoplasmic reticulum-type [Parcubacteria group bacterium Athens0714_26]|nr:MAG: signal peptidase, endoplasmic reticulum-type [Parcubacteria group bacterium Athens1014_26]TSD02543.1 MAG: signal peptidase, endoplasmic reticulum-type [Parcubacteria group bacterium Athens0714_26]
MSTKPFKIIYYVFLGAIAVIAILLVVSVLPITGNFKVLTVLSGSMEPVIHTGSVVVVKPSDSYKIGDIITFGEMGKTKTPITHRIYEMKVQGSQPVYITKGDANNAPDQKEITGKDIVGKVLFDVPYVGYAVETARKPLGFMLIIIVPAVIIIYDEGKKIWREIKKKKEPTINS